MIPINERSPEANEPLNLPNNSNFNKLTVKPVNQTNLNCLTTDTHQIIVKQLEISEHKIINTDAETKEILASIKTVFSYPEFTKLCNLDNQQLAAEYLNNILQQADTRTKRKWILQGYNPYHLNRINLFSCKHNDYHSLLTKAVFSNNEPICKVLIDNLESDSYIACITTYLHQTFDHILRLANLEDLSCNIIQEFFSKKCNNFLIAKQPIDINDYSAALYLYHRILPTIKHHHNIGTYYLLLCNLLSLSICIDVFDLIYQDIIALDEALVCKSLSQPKDLVCYENRLSRGYKCPVKYLASSFLTEALKRLVRTFANNGYENEKSYILDILKKTKYTEGSCTTNAHVQDIKEKTL
jgi:hypothetical protein